MFISTNSRELSRLRGKAIYSYEYGVNHQIGSTFVSLDVTVHLLVDPESSVFSASRHVMTPILRFLRTLPESVFRDVFDLYQLVSLFQTRELLDQGVYSDLAENDTLQVLMSGCEFMTAIYSRTPFSRIVNYYAQFEEDHLGDSFELYLSLA